MKLNLSNHFGHFVIATSLLLLIAGCKKKEDDNTDPTPNPTPSYTVTDVDGNAYDAISIGGQTWLKQNLRTTHYRDGSSILHTTDGWDWYHIMNGEYCDYDNDPANGATYGRLYNWYAVNTGILCPAGFHVPSLAEWNVLFNFLGGENVAGGKMKETGITHWASNNDFATNSSGFTALPGGYISSTGGFSSLTYTGYWWMSNEGSTDTMYAMQRFITYSTEGVYGTEYYKTEGLSVRCIKD